MPRHASLLAAGSAAAVALFAPAAASAVTVALDKPCYSHVPTQGSDPIVATLTGGTPGANFLLAATVPGKGTGSAGSVTGTFDAVGNGTAQIENVSPPSGTIGPSKGQVVNLSVQDFGAGGAEMPVGSATITNIALSVARMPSSPRAHRQVSISGVPFANQQMYGFIVKGSGKKVLKRIALGKANACGFTTRKVVVSPRTFSTGSYRFYVNAGTKLNKPLAVYSTFRLYKIVR